MLRLSRTRSDTFRRPFFSAPHARGGSCLLGMAIAALYCAPAQAVLSDTIHPFATVAYTYDDNLLRLPDNAPGFDGPRADSYQSATAGLSFERPIGQQILTGQASVSRVSFDHYDSLNYNGKDFLAALEWHVLKNFSGHIGGEYSQTLTPFSDYHSTELNLRVTRHEFVDGNWLFHPSWQVHAGYTRDRFSYDLQAEATNDRTEDAAVVGVDYLVASGSRIGLLARRFTGSYDHPQEFNGIPLNDGYHQNELKADIYWYVSGITQVQILAGWSKREHDMDTVRDSSGATGRINITWTPLGRIKFTASAWREFAAVESFIVKNSLNKGANVAAEWELSAKLKATANLRHEKRDFIKEVDLDLPGSATDSTNSSSVGLTYAPLPYAQLGVNVFHEQRTGSVYVGTGSYTANGVSISATGQF